MNPQTVAIAWYRSEIVRRLALSLVLQLLAYLGVAKYFTSGDLTPFINDMLECVGAVLIPAALHSRVFKPTPPLALTKAHADAMNAAAAPTPVAPTLPEKEAFQDPISKYEEIPP